METVEFPPVGRCARIEAGDTEALVTLDVGPRVISYGRKGGQNVFKVFEDKGPLGNLGCLLYGGHRLWVGPEVPELTYHADNDPVRTYEDEAGLTFACAPDARGIEKSITIRPDDKTSSLKLIHRLSNRSSGPREVFPWCLTVMAPGGQCVFPLPLFRPHTESVTPVAPLVLWSYTDLSDERWKFGARIIRLRQMEKPPQKIGAQVHQGWAAYALKDEIFLKRFHYDAGADYPDIGCNFETFTMPGMLEVESLGPPVRLGPGESVSHREAWYLLRGALPENDSECAKWLNDQAHSRPL